MRVILHTNILISALLVQAGTPGLLYHAWTDGAFTLLSWQWQLDELRATLRKSGLAERIRPHHAGHRINELKDMAVMVESCTNGS